MIGFLEFSNAVTAQSGRAWAGALGFGLTLESSDDFTIEPAVHVGLTGAADDLVLSLAFVVRF